MKLNEYCFLVLQIAHRHIRVDSHALEVAEPSDLPYDIDQQSDKFIRNLCHLGACQRSPRAHYRDLVPRNRTHGHGMSRETLHEQAPQR